MLSPFCFSSGYCRAARADRRVREDRRGSHVVPVIEAITTVYRLGAAELRINIAIANVEITLDASGPPLPVAFLATVKFFLIATPGA